MRSAPLALVALVGLVGVVGCKNKDKEGLPPAAEWKATGSGAMAPSGQPNPHSMAGNPHAGMDMGGKHPGPAGGDVTNMGLSGPDPTRKIDPNRYIRGSIKIHTKAKDRVKSGTGVFLIAKRADASGAPSGPPLAVDKLTWDKDELKFELTEANAMIAGTELIGDIVVTARYDQDGDAMTKQPGDITGEARIKVPAANAQIVLDKIL